jgi:hypothetical protein
VKYLIEHRLRFGEPDTLSVLRSALDDAPEAAYVGTDAAPSADVEWFTSDTPRALVSIIQNDWPYSGKAIYLLDIASVG